MMRHRTRTVYLLLAFALTFRSSAQEGTIPNRAAASGGKPMFFAVTRDIQPVALAELAAAADLIVVGSLVRPRGFLSDDKKDVYTDYELKLQRVIVDRGAFAAARTPGPTPPVTVTLYGGELMINVTRVRLDDMSLTRWKEGAPLLMFLARKKGDANRFEPCAGSAGLFEIDSLQQVKSLLNHAEKDREVGQLRLDQVLQRIKPQAGR